MLLAVDVGNTNVTLALFDNDKLVADWRVTSHRERTGDEIGVELKQLFALRGFELGVVSGVVISSVVPTLNPALVDAGRDVAVPYRWVSSIGDIVILATFPEHVTVVEEAPPAEEKKVEA